MNEIRCHHIKRIVAAACLSAALTIPLFAQDNAEPTSFPSFFDAQSLFDQEDPILEGLEIEGEGEKEGKPSRGNKAILTEQKEPSTRRSASERSFCLRLRHDMRKGAGIAAGVRGRGYKGLLQLESPMPMPYFEPSVKNFALGVYPLAGIHAHYPQKNIPSVFLGIGSLTFDAFFKKARCTGFSNMKAQYSGIRLPRKEFIGIGAARRNIDYGIEVHGKRWNGVFVASPEPMHQRMRYALVGILRIIREEKELGIAVQPLASFVPVPEKGGYHKLFGLSAILTHPTLSLETTGFLSYALDKTLSGSVQAACDIHARVVGMRTGASYTGENTVNWDGKRQKELIAAFIQPYLTTQFFSLSALYRLTMEQRLPVHRGAVTTQIKYGVIRWYTSWDYHNRLHTLKTALAFISKPQWFGTVQWFKKAGLGMSVVLRDKDSFPAVIKKYTICADSTFCITQSICCKLNGSFSQAGQNKDGQNAQLFYPKNAVYGGGIAFHLKREIADTMHSGTIKVSAKNEKPYINITLGYQVCH